MTNKIPFNTFTNTEHHTLWVEVNGKPQAVGYKLIRRAGFTLAMVEQTVAHFLFGCYALANFEDWGENDTWAKYEVTPSIENIPPAQHGEARVQIFGDIPVMIEPGKIISFPINIFTEYTSAHDLFDYVCDCLESNERIVDLENKFAPEDGAPTKQPSQPLAPQPERQPGKSGNTPYFEQVPSRQELGDKYDQTVIAIGILKIDVGFKDGQRTYEMYAAYRDGVSQYGFDTTRIYGKKKDGETFTAVNDATTVTYLEGLEMGTHKVNTRGVFWIQKSTTLRKNKDHEEYYPVYLNLNKLDIAHENAPKPGEESQLPPDGFEDVPDMYADGQEIPADDIPF